MTAINYYRWSLLLPILLPVLAIPSARGGDLLALALVTLLAYGGAPYAVWAIYAWFRLRGKGESEAQSLSLMAPLQVMPLTWITTGIIGVYDSFCNGRVSFNALSNSFLVYLMYGIVLGTTASVLLGYLCVVYVDTVLKRLKRWGWVWSAPGETVAL